MKKLNKREFVILAVTVGLVLFFVTFKFVVKPMQEGAVDINDQLRVAQGKLNEARRMIDQRAQVQARYQDLADTIGVVDSEEAQMPAIVSKIETAARENNIHIANIQPQRSVTQKEVIFLTVELEIDGGWPDIVQFFHALQQQPNFYFINELNLEKYSDTANTLRGRIVVSRMSLVNP